jgi:hypothetical protein
MNDTDQVPFKFIDSLKENQHIALFYEDPEYARMIEFRFIKNGLDLGQQCVYATEHDSGAIVLRMLTYGIPLKYFQDKRLRVYQIQRVCGGPKEIKEKCKQDITTILSNLRSPFRIVSRIVHDVSTKAGMSVELDLEKTTHSGFDSFGGTLICPYDISKIEHANRKQWLEDLRENHHAVIYASRFGQGGVFTCKN